MASVAEFRCEVCGMVSAYPIRWLVIRALCRNSIDLLRATDFRDGAFLCKLAVCETPI